MPCPPPSHPRDTRRTHNPGGPVGISKRFSSLGSKRGQGAKVRPRPPPAPLPLLPAGFCRPRDCLSCSPTRPCPCPCSPAPCAPGARVPAQIKTLQRSTGQERALAELSSELHHSVGTLEVIRLQLEEGRHGATLSREAALDARERMVAAKQVPPAPPARLAPAPAQAAPAPAQAAPAPAPAKQALPLNYDKTRTWKEARPRPTKSEHIIYAQQGPSKCAAEDKEEGG